MSSADGDDVYRQMRPPTAAPETGCSESERAEPAESRESNRLQGRGHEVKRQVDHGKTPGAAAAARPSLLAIASAAGKAASTSSTFIATVPRVQRSASNRSIGTESSGLLATKSTSNRNVRLSVQEPVDAPATASVPHTIRSKVPDDTPQSASSSLDADKDVDAGDAYSIISDAQSDYGDMVDGETVSLAIPIALKAGRPVPPAGLVDPDERDSIIPNEEEVLSWPPQRPDVDPRKLLREQLRRSESARLQSFRGRLRTDSSQSIQTIPPATSSTGLQSHSAHVNETRHVEPAESSAYAARAGKSSAPQRRYFVLTSAGKPVFASRLGWRPQHRERPQSAEGATESPRGVGNFGEEDEEDPEELLTSLVGVIQAIISLYAVENDTIRYIDAGELKIAFLLKAPIYLVAVSHLGEPESILRTHLEYLHLAILSITTQSSITSIFKERSNFDLRRLLAGTDNILNGLLESLQESSFGGDFAFQAVSGALKVTPFLSGLGANGAEAETTVAAKTIDSLRDDCTKALRPPRKFEQGMLYALLVSRSTLITLLRPKDHSIHPADLHILLSTINSTDALRTPNSESWIPICMPRFNSRGFLHAFISYLSSDSGGEELGPLDPGAQGAGNTEDLGLGIILVTADKEGFFDMKQWKDHIVTKLFQQQASPGGSVTSGIRLSLYKRLCLAIPLQFQARSITTGTASSEGPRPSLDGKIIDGRSSLIPDIPPIRHFWYRSKTHVQIFCSSPYLAQDTHGNYPIYQADPQGSSSRDIALQYLRVREALHNSTNRARGDGGARLVYLVTANAAILGLSTTTYELYACLPPLVSKTVATEAVHALARWIRKNESKIFLVSSASF